MLDLLNSVCLKISDPLLGWLLRFPLDAIIIIIAIATSAILTFVRLFTTNQDLLGRRDADKKRLKELIREAKKAGDREAIKRHRATMGLIGMKNFTAEVKPVLVSLAPIAILAVWCFGRIAYHPPQGNEEVELVAYFPASTVGEIVHVVPEPGLEVPGGPIRRIEEEAVMGLPSGVARWTLRGRARPEKPYTVTIRFDGETREREFLVGGRQYSEYLTIFPAGSRIEAAELHMREFKLFGFVPGVPAILLAPWIVAYLLIAIPFVLLLKRVFRIY